MKKLFMLALAALLVNGTVFAHGDYSKKSPQKKTAKSTQGNKMLAKN